VRLFAALWPPPEAVAALAADALRLAAPRGWRMLDPADWHVPLALHGDADPGVLARRLDGALRGRRAPRLRIVGGGACPGVRWAGLASDPPGALAGLVAATGGEQPGFVPRLAVLRRRPRPGPGAVPDPPIGWSEHCGPWWRPVDVLLVSSELARSGPRYQVVHRVALASGAADA
jgi:2'-5' RNA ligase